MRVLVLGGTGFIGSQLTKRLIAQPHVDVVVCSRSPRVRSLPTRAKHRILDRRSRSDMDRLAADGVWDVVFDHLCFTPEDVATIERLCKASGHYVMVSSQAVYGAGACLRESDFDYRHYSRDRGVALSYGEGKRRAEARLYAADWVPFTVARLPPVLGLRDPRNWIGAAIETMAVTGRVYLENPDARLSVTNVDEAAAFLEWVGLRAVEGPLNLASTGSLRLRDFVSSAAHHMCREVSVEQVQPRSTEPMDVHTGWESDSRLLPLSVHSDWVQSAERAEALGFVLSRLKDWFDPMIACLSLAYRA